MNKKLRKMVLLSNFLAIAIVLNFVDSLIPIPIPGARIGLANIVTLIVIYMYSWKEGIVIALLRVLLSTLIFGRWTQLPMSFTGTMLSTILMIILHKFNVFGIIVVSVLGALTHSIGQVFASTIFTSAGWATFYYLPVLLLISLPTGALTGIIANRFLKVTSKWGDAPPSDEDKDSNSIEIIENDESKDIEK